MNRLALLLVLVLAGCDFDTRSFAGFDGPTDIAYLPPGDFFEVPVAFVTNFRSGRVGKLDLKRTNLVVENTAAPWIPGPDLAFGADRALSEIALVEGEDTLTIWVADDSRDDLLRLPYISGRDDSGEPVWNRPELGEVRFFDADGMLDEGTAPELRGLRLRPGRATSETWSLTWNGAGFVVHGSASGLQDGLAVAGSPYETDFGELAFTLSLSELELERGASLEVDVLSGVESAEAGGLVMDLRVSDDGLWVFALVLPDEGDAWLAIWDAATFEEIDRVLFPVGASPERISAANDEGVFWIADSATVKGAGRIFRLDYVPGDLDTVALTSVAVPEPNIDVAEGQGERPRLFVAAAFSEFVHTLDSTTFEPIDINPSTPAVDATRLSGLITGLESGAQPIETAELDDDGTRFVEPGIVATTFTGELFLLNADSGCMFWGTPGRAHLDETLTSLSTLFQDIGAESNPVATFDVASQRLVTTHPCGGVSRTEDWSIVFDGETQSYEVEGSRSGVQANRLHEGVRYLSDEGAISMTILPGNRPTSHGDSWNFRIDDGIAPIQLQELPGDPLVYTETYDDRSGAYYRLRQREVAVVAHAGNDVVLWIDLQGQGAGLRAYQ